MNRRRVSRRDHSMYRLNTPLVLCPTIHCKTLLVKYLCGPHRQWIHPMRQSSSTMALGKRHTMYQRSKSALRWYIQCLSRKGSAVLLSRRRIHHPMIQCRSYDWNLVNWLVGLK
jgi:hypothetical protein